MRLIHLTDPHLSTLDEASFWGLRGKRRLGYLSWTRRRQALHQEAVLARIVAAVAEQQPDVIAVTGDLVQIALSGELQQAAAWLEQLATIARVVLVPGNHDLYQPDAIPAARLAWAEYLEVSPDPAAVGAFPTHHEANGISIIGLSSAAPQPFWSAGGELGGEQLERLRELLAATRGDFRCVLIHHPPLVGHSARRKALRDAAELQSCLQHYGAELVLHGHNHRNRETLYGGRTRVLATASASNASASAPASFRVLDIAPAAAGWEVDAALMSLDPADATIGCVEQKQWVFPRLTSSPASAA